MLHTACNSGPKHHADSLQRMQSNGSPSAHSPGTCVNDQRDPAWSMPTRSGCDT